MAVEVRWTPQAREDVIDIYIAIGLADPAVADKYLQALKVRAGSLSENPRLGRRREDIRPGARMLVEAPYVLFYKVMPDTESEPAGHIEIIRVLDGRRDLRKLLGS